MQAGQSGDDLSVQSFSKLKGRGEMKGKPGNDKKKS